MGAPCLVLFPASLSFRHASLGGFGGFFLPTSQTGGWKERNWRREAELPFRGRLRDRGAGVDAGRRAGLPLTPPAKPWPSVPRCWPAETAWLDSSTSFRRVTMLDASQELGLCVTCWDGAPPRQGGQRAKERRDKATGQAPGGSPAAEERGKLQEAPSGALLKKLSQQHLPAPPSPAPQTRKE